MTSTAELLLKPIDLMRHLVRLVTPPGGVVLDPFAGSGTTGLAASEEGFRSILIEREAEYVEIILGRLMATPMGLGLDVPASTSSYRPPANIPPPRFKENGVPKGWTGGWADDPPIEQPPAGGRASSKAPEVRSLGEDAAATAPDDASLSSGQPEADPLIGAPRQAWVEWYGEDVIEEAEHTFGISFDEEPAA